MQLCQNRIKATKTVSHTAHNGKMLDKNPCYVGEAFIVNGRTPEPVATIRVWGTDARSRASVWIKTKEDMSSGHGTAGGYGYHRGSAAVQQAIASAGYSLDFDISGSGTSYYPDAIAACLRAEGWEGDIYFHSAY